MLFEAGVFVHVGRLLGKHIHHHHRNADGDGDGGCAVHPHPAKPLCQWWVIGTDTEVPTLPEPRGIAASNPAPGNAQLHTLASRSLISNSKTSRRFRKPHSWAASNTKALSSRESFLRERFCSLASWSCRAAQPLSREFFHVCLAGV